jgi:hypothetical protein
VVFEKFFFRTIELGENSDVQIVFEKLFFGTIELGENSIVPEPLERKRDEACSFLKLCHHEDGKRGLSSGYSQNGRRNPRRESRAICSW